MNANACSCGEPGFQLVVPNPPSMPCDAAPWSRHVVRQRRRECMGLHAHQSGGSGVRQKTLSKEVWDLPNCGSAK